MPDFSKREVLRILKNNGYTLHHHKGSHAIYRNDKNQHLTIVPSRCNRVIIQRLIKENNLQV